VSSEARPWNVAEVLTVVRIDLVLVFVTCLLEAGAIRRLAGHADKGWEE